MQVHMEQSHLCNLLKRIIVVFSTLLLRNVDTFGFADQEPNYSQTFKKVIKSHSI